jgi:hypothetical protein
LHLVSVAFRIVGHWSSILDTTRSGQDSATSLGFSGIQSVSRAGCQGRRFSSTGQMRPYDGDPVGQLEDGFDRVVASGLEDIHGMPRLSES